MVLLNKCDLVASSPHDKCDQVALVEGAVRGLNPRAKVIRSHHSRCDLDEVIGTGRWVVGEAREILGGVARWCTCITQQANK